MRARGLPCASQIVSSMVFLCRRRVLFDGSIRGQPAGWGCDSRKRVWLTYLTDVDRLDA